MRAVRLPAAGAASLELTDVPLLIRPDGHLAARFASVSDAPQALERAVAIDLDAGESRAAQ